jgi:hypothetical protein
VLIRGIHCPRHRLHERPRERRARAGPEHVLVALCTLRHAQLHFCHFRTAQKVSHFVACRLHAEKFIARRKRSHRLPSSA